MPSLQVLKIIIKNTINKPQVFSVIPILQAMMENILWNLYT